MESRSGDKRRHSENGGTYERRRRSFSKEAL